MIYEKNMAEEKKFSSAIFVFYQSYTQRIYASETTLMHIHSNIPWNKGRMPTAFNVSRVNEAPIKNRER